MHNSPDKQDDGDSCIDLLLPTRREAIGPTYSPRHEDSVNMSKPKFCVQDLFRDVVSKRTIMVDDQTGKQCGPIVVHTTCGVDQIC
jgi:hypothetical protein